MITKRSILVAIFCLILVTPFALSGLPNEERADRVTTDSSLYFCPGWSPDGRRICFSSDHGIGDWTIGCMNENGSNKQELTSLPGWDFCQLGAQRAIK